MQGKQTWTMAALASALLALPSVAQQQLTVGLEEAQDRALDANQMLEQAREGLAQAQAMQMQTWAGHLPSVTLTQQMIRTNNALNVFGFRLRQERVAAADFDPRALNDPAAISDFQTLLEVRQPLLNGGKTIYGRRQARAGVRSAEAQLRRAEQQVRLHTAQGYWGMVLAREALVAVRQSLETVRAHADIAQAHFEQETAPLSDLLAALVRVAELRGQEVDAANRVATAADNLSLVMGLEQTVELVPVDSLAYLTVTRDLEELTRTALALRADLVAAGYQTDAAAHGVKAARAEFLPHLNAFAQVDLDAEGLLERQGESWTVGAMVTWNLFDGLKSAGGHRGVRAQLGQARAQRSFLEQQVVRDVAAGWRQVSAAQIQVEIASEAVAQANERLRMTDLQYRQALITATDLLDAETALTHARIRRLQALHALNLGMAQLEFAVGQPL